MSAVGNSPLKVLTTAMTRVTKHQLLPTSAWTLVFTPNKVPPTTFALGKGKLRFSVQFLLLQQLPLQQQQQPHPLLQAPQVSWN